MQNSELFNKESILPLTVTSADLNPSLDGIEYARLVDSELKDSFDEKNKIFKVVLDIEHANDGDTGIGEQEWDCYMKYESPQTGWKIEGFGH